MVGNGATMFGAGVTPVPFNVRFAVSDWIVSVSVRDAANAVLAPAFGVNVTTT